MSGRLPGLAERKRLLLARAELGRIQIRQAGHEARSLLAPLSRFAPVARRREATRIRPLALALTAAAVPLLGAARLARLLRIAGTGIAVLRLARRLRS